MKKTITVASVGMVIGFAVALANASENSSMTTPSDQQAGTSGSPTGSGTTTGSGAMSGSDMMNSPTTGTGTGTSTGSTSVSTHDWKNMKSCTDENGTTFRRGDKGFNSCISWMKKQSQNQSGMMGTDPSTRTGSTSSSDNMPTDDQAGIVNGEAPADSTKPDSGGSY